MKHINLFRKAATYAALIAAIGASNATFAQEAATPLASLQKQEQWALALI